MAPFLVDGDVLVVDPDLQPKDGDVVRVAMRYHKSSTMLGNAARQSVTHDAVKQYRNVDGKAWLCSADGSVDASYHQITGTVVAWCRGGLGLFTWRKRMAGMDFRPDNG